jgi:hypothetical protein
MLTCSANHQRAIERRKMLAVQENERQQQHQLLQSLTSSSKLGSSLEQSTEDDIQTAFKSTTLATLESSWVERSTGRVMYDDDDNGGVAVAKRKDVFLPYRPADANTEAGYVDVDVHIDVHIDVGVHVVSSSLALTW